MDGKLELTITDAAEYCHRQNGYACVRLLLPSSEIWCRSKGIEAVRLGR